jgi:4-oxalocrotonate tautomerase
MPYVNIRITDEGATREQKLALVAGVTELLAWIGGELVSDRRKRGI